MNEFEARIVATLKVPESRQGEGYNALIKWAENEQRKQAGDTLHD